MHLTVTRFELAPHLTEAEVLRMSEQSTERYTQMPGLLDNVQDCVRIA